MIRRLLFVSAGAALVAAGGCSSDTSDAVRDGGKKVTKPADPPTPIPADDVEAATKTATLGQSLTLAGLDDSERFTVTVLAYKRDVEGADSELDVPASGNRFDAVQLRIETVGSTAYENAPSNETRIVVGAEQFNASAVGETKAGTDFSDDDIAPGKSETGWVTFELRDDAKVTAVQFASDTESVGRWTVG